jgi:hypothetical protein
LGYLWDISGTWIGQGYDQVLDTPGVSFEVFGISLGYPKSRKDIPNSENLEWDIPKLMMLHQDSFSQFSWQPSTAD